MRDDLNAHGGREDSTNRGANERQKGEPARMADREVPIELTRTPDQVHAWLDGEIPEGALRGSDAARHVAFWNRVGTDLEVRRAVKAPVGLADRIMEAMPEAHSEVAVHWWSKSVEMTPLAAAAAAAGLLAVGTAVGAVIRGR